MKRRVFVAIEFPEKLRRAVSELIREWRWLPAHWLPAESWHVTLAPPAMLDDDEIRNAIDALSGAELGAPFPLVFRRMAVAPPAGSARMIWLEGEPTDPIKKLQERVERLLKSTLAIPPAGREFRLHATLARFESGGLKELEKRAPVLAETNLRASISAISVMESHLKPSGAEYERIEEVYLK